MNRVKLFESYILIIDDHPIYLDGLEMLLSHTLNATKVLKARNLDEANALLNAGVQLDLILLDIQLNKMSGFDLCELDLYKNQAIAILSASENQKDIIQAKKLGLLGFLNKACEKDKLISDIQALLQGNCVFPEIIPYIALTPRQQDVLNLLAQGYPNKTICNQLKLSEATVKTHLRALFNIFDVHTRTQCVNVARDENLI
ncbi:response regulator transcription factor [Pseudomonas sp. HK3]